MVFYVKFILSGFLFCFFISCKNNPTPSTDNVVIVQDTIPALSPLDSTLYQWENGKILVNWKDLMDIYFKKQAHPLVDSVDIPQFNARVLAMHGREVIIEGFYIPVEETGDENIVILSAYPFAQCFFCGQAGVESIVDVLIKEKLPPIKTDTKVRFSGKFKTNPDDFDFLIYMLEDPVFLK